VLSTFAGPVTAVLGGLATAIGGGLIFNYPASRKRETTGSLSTNLTIQWNQQSLGRDVSRTTCQGSCSSVQQQAFDQAFDHFLALAVFF
jgi:hypothetical protein